MVQATKKMIQVNKSIQQMLADWPVEDLDSSEKIKAWLDRDE